MTVQSLRRIYVWEMPVRIFHWLNALSIIVLCVTGYLIGNPPGIISNEEASYQYLFGWIRFIHFASAYIFVFNTIFRLYWAFAGNKYAHWRNFVPTNMKFIRDMWDVVKTDIIMVKKGAFHTIGHNPLAGFIYFFSFVFFIVQMITGFGLYAGMSEWWFPQLFAWAPVVFGGDFMLRNIHHTAMWFFILFTMIHVYLVIYHDYVEGRGEISSMGGGWKFIEKDIAKKHESTDKAA